MADEWYEFVTPSHFWIQWRFAVIRKLLPKSNDWGNTLDIGCGNGAVGQQIESYYGICASGCDLNEKATLKFCISLMNIVKIYLVIAVRNSA